MTDTPQRVLIADDEPDVRDLVLPVRRARKPRATDGEDDEKN